VVEEFHVRTFPLYVYTFDVYARIYSEIWEFICAHRHETHKRIFRSHFLCLRIRSKKSKITCHLGKIDTHPEKKETENTKEQKNTLCLCFRPLHSKKSQPKDVSLFDGKRITYIFGSHFFRVSDGPVS